MKLKSQVAGCGAFLPEQIVTNDDLVKRVDTNDEWIVSRTGIKQRHITSLDQPTSVLATKAAQKALENAGITVDQVDAIILATTTPDHPFPATATRVQTALGAKNAFAFDVQAVCSGFVYALSVADNFIKCGQSKTVLVIGADAMSCLIDWQDRNTCVLFGDGAAALVLKSVNVSEERGVLSTHLFSDGTNYDALYVDNSKSTENNRGYIRMNGRSIYVQAVKKIGQAIEHALEANKLTTADIDWFVPHQANKRIIDSVSDHFNIPPEKTVLTIDLHANTSAASIPLALYTAVNDGRIKPGHMVLIEAMGGGLTWGSALIRW